MGHGSKHFKPDVTFSGLQISKHQQQLAGHLWSAPTLLIFSLKDAEMSVKDGRDYNRNQGGGCRAVGRKQVTQCGGLALCEPHLWELGPYLRITRYVDEQGISYWKLFPGLDILSHNLKVCYLLPSLEKLKTKTVHSWRWLLLWGSMQYSYRSWSFLFQQEGSLFSLHRYREQSKLHN